MRSLIARRMNSDEWPHALSRIVCHERRDKMGGAVFTQSSFGVAKHAKHQNALMLKTECFSAGSTSVFKTGTPHIWEV